MGDRTIETVGSCCFEDLTNHRKAVMITGTHKKTGWIRSTYTGSKDEVEGVIYKSSKLSGDRKSVNKNYARDCDTVSDLKHLKDMKQQICSIQGSWLKNLIIDG